MEMDKDFERVQDAKQKIGDTYAKVWQTYNKLKNNLSALKKSKENIATARKELSAITLLEKNFDFKASKDLQIMRSFAEAKLKDGLICLHFFEHERHFLKIELKLRQAKYSKAQAQLLIKNKKIRGK